MKRTALIMTAALLAAPVALLSQAPSPMGGLSRGWGAGSRGTLSRVGIGGGVSPLGIEMQAATNLGEHLGLRAIGNFFSHTTDFTTDGISATGKLNLSSARVSVDFYPFHSGFRISPGVLLKNQNRVTATANVPAGTSFTLNDQTYYSANTNALTGATPITGSGALGLSSNNPAFTATAGWGNIARGNGHWSFPAEVGVAFIGAPTLKVNLSGWACVDQAQTQCSTISGSGNPIAAEVQSNLTAQVAKWTKDLDPLKTYPIVSVGVAYSFRVR